MEQREDTRSHTQKHDVNMLHKDKETNRKAWRCMQKQKHICTLDRGHIGGLAVTLA